MARQVTDLLQDLNEIRPNVVHFSGHGSQGALVFEDSDGDAKSLTNSQLASLLEINSNRIRLAVFNSCQSASQAELATDHIQLAIGMSASIEDDAAKTFAAQFYNSLGFGNSVARAFAEAKLQVELEHGDGQHIPQLFAAQGVDADTVVLVNPD